MRMLVVVLVSMVSLPVAAQTAYPSERSPRGAIYAVAGLGTPVGFFGLEGVYRIVPQLEVALGMGLGLSAEQTADNNQLHVLQWALMPRYRVGEGRNVLTVGAGLSGGNYSHVYASLCGGDDEVAECNSPGSYRYTLWSNVEVGGEYWAASLVAFRYFVGYGHILAQGAQHCDQPSFDCSDDPPGSFPYANIPYFGIAVGGWL